MVSPVQELMIHDDTRRNEMSNNVEHIFGCCGNFQIPFSSNGDSQWMVWMSFPVGTMAAGNPMPSDQGLGISLVSYHIHRKTTCVFSTFSTVLPPMKIGQRQALNTTFEVKTKLFESSANLKPVEGDKKTMKIWRIYGNKTWSCGVPKTKKHLYVWFIFWVP